MGDDEKGPTPTRAAVDDSDAIFEIWKYPTSGQPFEIDGFELVQRVGEPTTPNTPADVLPLPDGTVLVADTGLARIVHFDQNGESIGVWGETGEWGPLRGFVTRLASGRQGDVYALASGGAILRFDASGVLDQSFSVDWGTDSFGESRYLGVLTALAIDSQGNLYVGMVPSGDKNLIVQISPDGRPAASWQVDESCNSGGIAIDATDQVYASCSNGIYRLPTDGEPELFWTSPKIGDGRISPMSLTSMPDGTLVALLSGGYSEDAGGDRIYRDWVVEHLDTDGSTLAEWTVPRPEEPYHSTPPDISVDDQGRIYVPVPQEQRVMIFDDDGDLAGDLHDERQATFSRVDRLAIDADGNVYVLDLTRQQVVRVSPDGEIAATIPIPDYTPYIRTGFDQLHGQSPDLAVDSNGDLFLAVKIPGLLLQFSQSGDLIKRWDFNTNRLSNPHSPSSMAIDSSGLVYTLDTNGGDIEVIDSISGNTAGDWDVELEYDQYHIGADLWISGETIYIAGYESLDGQDPDLHSASLHKFDLRGRDLGRVVVFEGHPLSSEGPVSVVTDELGNVYAVTWRLSASDPVTQPGYEGQPVSELLLRAFTPDGDLFASGLLGLPNTTFNDLVVSADGQRLYISDPNAHQILVYQRTP